MNYFQNCKTPEERKARWKELAKRNHPDLGGDLSVMQEINRQYAKIENVKVRKFDPRSEQYETVPRHVAISTESKDAEVEEMFKRYFK